MDSSIKVNLILGIDQVSRLEPDESLKIVNHVLSTSKPLLKYLSGFKLIGELLNWTEAYDERKTDEAIMEFPEGIDQKSRYIRIDQVCFTTEGRLGYPLEDHGVASVTERNILLSQKGKYLDWLLKYRRDVRYGSGYKEHRTGISEIVEICKFSFLEENELLKLFEQKPDLVLTIVQKLNRLTSRTLVEKEQRLASIRNLERQLGGIVSRIAKTKIL